MQKSLANFRLCADSAGERNRVTGTVAQQAFPQPHVLSHWQPGVVGLVGWSAVRDQHVHLWPQHFFPDRVSVAAERGKHVCGTQCFDVQLARHWDRASYDDGSLKAVRGRRKGKVTSFVGCLLGRFDIAERPAQPRLELFGPYAHLLHSSATLRQKLLSFLHKRLYGPAGSHCGPVRAHLPAGDV